MAMIDYIVFALIPLVLIFTAPILQIIFSVLTLLSKTRLTLFWITFLALVAGSVLPVAAGQLTIAGLPPGAKCLMPNAAFVIGGWIITMVSVPAISFIFFIIYWFTKRGKATVN